MSEPAATFETAVTGDGESPLLDVLGLSTHFHTDMGTVKAVDGVDLSIDRGEIVSVVGESGSGKSATAFSIARLIAPPGETIAGEILFDGRDLLQMSEKEMSSIRGNRIAMVFQEPKAMLDPTSRVGAHIVEPLRLFGGLSKTAAWNRAVELLHAVDIPDPEQRAQSYASEMSGGMAQRVMIAAALAGEPELLIADEPTTALDVTVQAQILQLIKKLCKENNMALMLISHDLGVVAAISDRVAVMYKGQIVEEADVGAIFADAQHPYTRSLMRASLLTEQENGQLFALSRSEFGTELVGCRFMDRCTQHAASGLTDACISVAPLLVEVGNNRHKARCLAVKSSYLEWPEA